MTKVTELPIRKIAIFRALKLGDFLLSTPVFKALRRAFPDAEIDYIGLPWSLSLAERYAPYIDHFVEFPGFPGFPERDFQPTEIVDFLMEVQRQKYDLVLQLQGKGSISNSLVALFGAPYLAGFAAEDTYWPNRDLFMTYPEGLPEVMKNLALLEFLGVDITDIRPEFPVLEDDARRLGEDARYQSLEGQPYVCLHPGAITASPWPIENFARVADACAERGLAVVVTGSDQEAPLADDLMRRTRARVINMTGRTDLGMLGALLNGSRLVVSNDTGVAHLAVAVDAPSITVFTTTDPAIWAPLDQMRHRIVTGEAAEMPAAVLALAREMLDEERNETDDNDE